LWRTPFIWLGLWLGESIPTLELSTIRALPSFLGNNRAVVRYAAAILAAQRIPGSLHTQPIIL
jgi:hypothetical protein